MEQSPAETNALDSTPAEFFCPECGYDLRAITSDRCPECGLAIDRASMSVSRLPWSHRDKIGRFRAYWRTMLLSPRKIAGEMARPVSLADAQRFRDVTVFLAWVPLAAWAVGLALYNTPNLIDRIHAGTRLGWFLEGIVLLSALFALWLFLLMATGVASYFFHPKRLPVVLQNRAVALSYYACGPLAWVWVSAVLAAVFVAIESQDWSSQSPVERFNVMLLVVAELFTVATIIVCWLRSIIVLWRTTRCGTGRIIALVVYLPLAWGLTFGLAALAPATVLYISLMILSMR